MFVSTTGEEKAASQQRQHNTQRNDGRNTERKDGVRDTAIWQRLRVDVLSSGVARTPEDRMERSCQETFLQKRRHRRRSAQRQPM